MELGEFFMMTTWRLVACLGVELIISIGESRRKVLSPKWHGDTWLFAWRLMLDLRTVSLRD